jgi:hypothetical protein
MGNTRNTPIIGRLSRLSLDIQKLNPRNTRNTPIIGTSRIKVEELSSIYKI